VVVYRASQNPLPDSGGSDLQWVAKRNLGDLPLSTTAKKALILLAKKD
jgi:hypothetical protein